MAHVQPEISGDWGKVSEITAQQKPVFLPETDLKLEKMKSAFGIALHMHQPLIPAGPGGEIISNLDFMLNGSNDGDRYNAAIYCDCYGRMGDLVRDAVQAGRSPRAMLDYSGQLFYAFRAMQKNDIIERLRPLAVDPILRRKTEFMGTMWAHAVASSTPIPDYRLQMRAWQQEYGKLFGWDALARVRGFSPPEMHLPNHPDVAFEYIKTLKECGYLWLLVQEHTVEAVEGHEYGDRHMPYRLVSKNSRGEEISILALIKTQGSDTKLVAQMQPLYEAQNLQRRQIGGIDAPRAAWQIGDGENGGVMMNEFPSGYRQGVDRVGTEGTVMVNGTEYLELLIAGGMQVEKLPAIRPAGQGFVLSRIKNFKEGAADAAIADIKKENPHYTMEGGSWTSNMSWVKGYEDVLDPMNRLSAQFHDWVNKKKINEQSNEYHTALYYLLTSQTSCYRYWGQGVWTDYAKILCDKGLAATRV